LIYQRYIKPALRRTKNISGSPARFCWSIWKFSRIQIWK